jgi:hypothetical protein
VTWGVDIDAPTAAPNGGWESLWTSVAWLGVEEAHRDFRTVDDPEVDHHVTIRFDRPRAIAGVRVRFRSGYRPRRVVVEPHGAALIDIEPETDDLQVPVRATLAGFTLRMPAGCGALETPGVLRLRSLAITPAEALGDPAEPRLELEAFDGTRHAPAMPLSVVPLELSDHAALWIDADRPVRRVGLDLLHVDTVGSPDMLRAWLGALPAEVGRPTCRGPRVVLERAADASGPIRIPLPPWRAFVMRLEALELDPEPLEPLERVERAGVPDDWRRAAGDPLGEALRAGEWRVGAARALVEPPRHAASLGIPGADARVGVSPSGTLLLRPPPSAPRGRSHTGCVYADLRLGTPNPRRIHQPDGLDLLGADGRRITLRIAGDVLRVEGAPSCHLDHFDGLSPLARDVQLDSAPLRWPDGRPFGRRTGTALHFNLADGPGPLPPIRFAAVELPDPTFDHILRGLFETAPRFLQRGAHTCYGIWPSVYAGDVFGLEEDYLFYGMALWGAAESGLAAFRATYLTDAHLAKSHYLHDLRNALTPWQAERLLAISGRRFVDLEPSEQARLLGLGEWIRALRAADPLGLLPPYRYGGDLSFPARALHTDAIGCVALARLADMTGDATWAAEAADYRRAVDAALARVRDPETGFQPLHEGAGDPGQYHQLMAAGILAPVGYFPPGDARAAALLDGLEPQGRLVMGLPRFDVWGGDRFGLDAHYGVGHLLWALAHGRRDTFWTGLHGLVSAAMDPELFTFAEVEAVWPPGGRPPQGQLPGARLGQAAPCIGGPGAVLQLLRHAIVRALPEADGRPSARLRLLDGIPPSWWATGRALRVERLPTRCGPVTIEARRRAGRLYVEYDAPGAESVEITGVDP